MRMDNLEFDREPPATRLTTLVMAFGGWIDAGRAATGAYDAKEHAAVEAATYYWHFVDIVWIGLFATIYLIQ